MVDRHTSNTGAHAIVIGGGLAGLLATRVLADHFDRVTLIERDQVASRPEPRKGVPQGNHVHGLLMKGELIMSQLFPDLMPALIAGGAIPMDMGLDFRWHHHGVWKTCFHSGITGSLFSRPYLEWHIAERVRALRNVRIIHAAVEGLAVDAERRRVVGVNRRVPADRNGLLPASLVVDASGHGSQTPQWLEAIGYKRPAESTVKVNVTYASRLYRRAPNRGAWKALLVSPRAPAKKMAAVFPIEGDRWMVTLGGLHGLSPPTDEAGYLEFLRSLPVPDVHQAIAGAEPLTPITTHRFSTNLRRHYERLESFPEGLMVMGDALCSFNPVYGQGMTVSALEAMALDAVMREYAPGDELAGLPARFHARISAIVDIPWRLATGEDFRHEEAVGERPRGTSFLHWYTGRLHEKCAYDSSLALAFYRVMHMIEPPSTLFRPAVMLRVLRRRRTSARQRTDNFSAAHRAPTSGSAVDRAY
jgi:flavin-dependent dehydrogenase